jgi:hypothetical protein
MEDFWHPHTSIAHLAKRVWLQGFLAGLGVVVAISMVWVLVRGIPAPSTPQDSAATVFPPQAEQASKISAVPPITETSFPPSDTATVLKTHVEEVLARVKQANQNKNLAQLLILYSPTFPELSQKTQKIARSWETYNYPKMEFLIEELKPLTDSRVFARVTWDIQMEDLQTKNFKEVTRTYLVWFIKESGDWRIQSLKKAE